MRIIDDQTCTARSNAIRRAEVQIGLTRRG